MPTSSLVTELEPGCRQFISMPRNLPLRISFAVACRKGRIVVVAALAVGILITQPDRSKAKMEPPWSVTGFALDPLK